MSPREREIKSKLETLTNLWERQVQELKDEGDLDREADVLERTLDDLRYCMNSVWHSQNDD